MLHRGTLHKEKTAAMQIYCMGSVVELNSVNIWTLYCIFLLWSFPYEHVCPIKKSINPNFFSPPWALIPGMSQKISKEQRTSSLVCQIWSILILLLLIFTWIQYFSSVLQWSACFCHQWQMGSKVRKEHSPAQIHQALSHNHFGSCWVMCFTTALVPPCGHFM